MLGTGTLRIVGIDTMVVLFRKAALLSIHYVNVRFLQEGTLTPKDSSGILTLTGWSAVMGMLALVAVTIGAATWGYRRYHGLDGVKGYIRVVKGKSPEGL